MKKRAAILIGIAAFIASAGLAAADSTWTAPSGMPPNNNVPAPINVGSASQVKNGNAGFGGLAVFGNTLLSGAAQTYLNFGSSAGSSGYGFRDNGGAMEFKNSGGAWAPIGLSGGANTDTLQNVTDRGNSTTQNVTANAVFTNEWFRVNTTNAGTGGIYWSNWGGGWYMNSSSWIQTYGSAGVFFNGGFDSSPSAGASGVGCNGGKGGSSMLQVCNGTLSVKSNFSNENVTINGNQVWDGTNGNGLYLQYSNSNGPVIVGGQPGYTNALSVYGPVYVRDALTVPTICLGGDCRSSWPSGGGGGPTNPSPINTDTLQNVTDRGNSTTDDIGGRAIYANDWFRVNTTGNGTGGIYWQNWGSGFYMSDNYWIRGYNPNSGLWMNNGNIGTNGAIVVGYNGTGGVSPGGGIFSGNVGVAGKAANSGFPSGWGGLHTQDVYAEGTLGAGTNGSLGAYISSNGSGYFTGKIGTFGRDPNAGLPSGWGGGVHTLDVYAEGTVGAGPSGGPPNAYINNGGYGYFSNTVTASAFLYPSDRRLKTNIETIPDALQKVEAINGVTYNWKDVSMGTTTQVGVIAQDVQSVLPEAVHTDSKGIESVDYSRLVPLLINAVKEQQEEISDLKSQVASLQAAKQ